MSPQPSTSPPTPAPGVVSVQQLPAYNFARMGNLPLQIAAYFRRVFLTHRTQDTVGCPTVILPNLIHLTGFFKCSETEVMHALQELTKQGYQYEIYGLDAPIVLKDPLFRHTRPIESWRRASDERTKPFYPTGPQLPWMVLQMSS